MQWKQNTYSINVTTQYHHLNMNIDNAHNLQILQPSNRNNLSETIQDLLNLQITFNLISPVPNNVLKLHATTATNMPVYNPSAVPKILSHSTANGQQIPPVSIDF